MPIARAAAAAVPRARLARPAAAAAALAPLAPAHAHSALGSTSSWRMAHPGGALHRCGQRERESAVLDRQRPRDQARPRQTAPACAGASTGCRLARASKPPARTVLAAGPLGNAPRRGAGRIRRLLAGGDVARCRARLLRPRAPRRRAGPRPSLRPAAPTCWPAAYQGLQPRAGGRPPRISSHSPSTPNRNTPAPPPPPSSRAGRRAFTTSASMGEAGGSSGGKRITQNEFTEKGWQAIVAAPEVAQSYSQQVRGFARGCRVGTRQCVRVGAPSV